MLINLGNACFVLRLVYILNDNLCKNYQLSVVNFLESGNRMWMKKLYSQIVKFYTPFYTVYVSSFKQGY